MNRDDDAPWEGRCLQAAHKFALLCEELKRTNPYDRPVLNEIMTTLATELWDQSFSQAEIRAALEKALAELPIYAAGEERRR